MLLHKMASLREYSNYLCKHPAETKDLFNDILIPVTGFFRDPAAFQALRRRILPRLFRSTSADHGIRVWVPGCSTGEEVYSLAIVLNEASVDRGQRPVQIFGTDINDSSLERARAGVFPERIQAEVSPDRLRRYFARCDGGFRVSKAIRDTCIFARQNLAADPPFSNLDLISCRNVLIYLASNLQRKVFPVFHYALRPNGLLMLGASETVGAFSDLFGLADKKAKVYVKKAVHTRPSVSFINSTSVPTSKDSEAHLHSGFQLPPSLQDIQKASDRIVLSSFGPAGVIINRNYEVLQFRGKTGPFLEHPHGEASLNLFTMAREWIVFDLRRVVNKAVKLKARSRHDHIRARQEGDNLECAIEVVPFTVAPGTEPFYLVIFEGSQSTVPGETKTSSNARGSGNKSRQRAEISHLQDEITSMRGSMQGIVEEHEATNEELRSANEEIMSSNEELQSTNEELETAKEELQSTNEELTTLNDELESRNSELHVVNNDLHNLLASVSIPVLILSADLRIRRFTAAAERLFKLIPGDVGRPITDINVPLDIPDLGREVLEVLDSLVPKNLDVRDRTGHRWSVRIRAYKTMENKIDGVVMALVDIEGLKSPEGPAE
jgi:two-component system CheB/CheR fusion protein